MFGRIQNIEMKLPSRRENRGVSKFRQFDNLANSEGSHVDRRLRGLEGNCSSSLENNI